MSRIGKQPIALPEGVTVAVEAGGITINGPRGTLAYRLPPEVGVAVDGRMLHVKPRRMSRRTPALWGTARATIARLVDGVARGVERKLEIEGIGYRALLEGPALVLAIGLSHPVRVEPPAGISFRVEKNGITVSGSDAALVGDVAARIRSLRPPEPYKGKGIRYAGEVIRRKAGKKAVTTGA